MRKYSSLKIIILTAFLLSFPIHTFGGRYEGKELCQKVFGIEKGSNIYEAYLKIAYLKYVPEEKKLDVWQTPLFTENSKKGDCEDAVFLFSSNLSGVEGWLVWGFVIHNDGYTRVVRAHVWYELEDEKGNIYVVEGFKDCGLSGIIPMYIINRTEERQAILRISQKEFDELKDEKRLGVFQAKAELQIQMDTVMLGLGENKRQNKSQYADITSRQKRIPMYVPNAMFKYFPESWGKSDFEKAMAKDKEIHEIYTQLHELMKRIREEKV